MSTTDPKAAMPKHPVGTLALLAVYGAVFALGWLALFLFVYGPRGAIQP
jgi:hypothetical protein